MGQNWLGGGSGKQTDYAALIRKQADETLKRQKENVDALISRVTKLADQFVAAEKQKGETYRVNQEKLDSTYLGRVRSDTDLYSRLLSDLFTEEKGLISQYELDTKDLATKSGQEAVDFNLKNVDNFISFANSLTFAAQDARRELIRAANPYVFEQQEQISKNNLDLVSGRLPAAALANSARGSAYASFATGIGAGSGMGRALEARNLSLDTLAAMQQGEQSAASWADLTFRQQVEGLQTTPAQVAEYMGLDSKTVFAFNAANAEKILNAKQNVIAGQKTGLNTVLAANLGAFDAVYNTSSAMEKALYVGGTDAAVRAMDAKAGAYDTGASLYGGAISDWGNTRTKVLAQQWQNQIAREEARKQNNAALISGITTIAGGLAGFALGGPAGAGVGSTLGGAAGGAIAGATGNASGGAASFGDIWGGAFDTFSSLASNYRNPKLNGGVETYNNRNTLLMNVNQDWAKTAQNFYNSGQRSQYQPMTYTNWGGWIPRATVATAPTLTTRS